MSKSLANNESPNWGDGVALESPPRGRGKFYLLLTIIALVVGAAAYGFVSINLTSPTEVVLDEQKQEEKRHRAVHCSWRPAVPVSISPQ